MIPLLIGLIIVFIVLLASFVCFVMAFYAPEKDKTPKEEYPIPRGKIYIPHRDKMVEWMKEVRTLEHEDVSITSFDGLKLCGKYYEYKKGAPCELLMHGYRGSAERDMCGAVQRCFSIGRNALIIDQRGAGKSEGNVITFGAKESRDCISWVEFMIDKFGPDVKIIISGISMGAATVVLAAGRGLPKNVVGVLADCGYSSAREMIEKTIREMHLPPKLLYPFVALGARIFAGFDLRDAEPIAAVKNAKVPIIFLHGDADEFVPCYMSERMYEACPTPKKFVKVEGAGHGLAYIIDGEGYLKALEQFWTEVGVPTEIQMYKNS